MPPDEFTTPYKPRRPASRPERYGGEPAQVWTAARCQRLLRPLLSRIASIRKEATASISNPADDHEYKQQATTVAERQSTECEWLMPRKRIRLTYSQRKASSGKSEKQAGTIGQARPVNTSKCLRHNERTLAPGELIASTPLLRRARGQFVPSPGIVENGIAEPEPCKSRPGRDSRGKRGLPARQKDLDQRLITLRSQLGPNRHHDLEAIYKSFEALLKATRHDTNSSRGPRSFLDMCLRKVPQYIEELEAWERMEAEQNGTVSMLDEVDTSAQIYNELESIGSNHSWKHLRVVVRADGLNAMKQAISEGLFGNDFLQLLVDLCVQIGALSEAEELVAVLVDRQYPQPLTTDSSFAGLSSLQPLSTLWTFANKSGHTSFLLRQYSLLLSNNSLPQDWLATREFERVWELAARRLATADDASDAATFMSQAISLLCCRRRTLTGGPETARLEKDMALASRQTLTSALAILAAMSSLGENELLSTCISKADATKISLLGTRIRYIFASIIAELRSTRATRAGLGNDLLHMALFLSSNQARSEHIKSQVKNSLGEAWRQNSNPSSVRSSRTRHNFDEIASFISSVARSCGRGMSLASHNCLDMIFQQLGGLELEQEILDTMKAAAAFLLAQQTSNVRDLIYAERLTSSQSLGRGHDAHSRPLFTGYRWEETIGEWVTASPVRERRQARTTTRQLRSSSAADVDRGKSAEQATRQLESLIYCDDADSVADLQTDRGGSTTRPSPNPGTQRATSAKKRTYASRDSETSYTTTTTKTDPSRQSSHVALASKTPAHLLPDELGADKENENRGPTKKKPRKSVERIVLGAKPRSNSTSQRVSMYGDDYSDDELCMI
ncbi:hypothetical protein F4779DRAFT_560854 [Xylariaceae sp. FL0662B]|nr:hypothetical protein F4779DRAFT_560854 [Xylariaceae sp. FL0662B]